MEPRPADFALLGPLEVRAGATPLRLGGTKQRAVLALLLVNANRVLSFERLVDELWADPPETAVKTIQVYVSKLRKVLPHGVLVSRPHGYALEVDPEAIDARRLEHALAEARSAEPAGAARILGDALTLWRGAPLAEFVEEPFARVEAERLAEVRLRVIEERVEADLALGRDAELVGELEALVAEHPHRERFRRQLMLALYRSGRQADALAAYRDARAALDELGLEPGGELRELERRILRQDLPLAPSGGPLLVSADGRLPLPGPLVPNSPFPFVGRVRELEALEWLLGRAEAGEGGLVLLTGEAGAGKTRLVRELAHAAAARRVLVCYGASDPTVSVLYQPVRDWFAFLVASCEPAALRECLGDRAEPVARLIPELTTLVQPGAGPIELDADRYLLESAMTDFFGRAARRQTLLLIADDVHWVDEETPRLLQRLARAAPAARLLVVVSFRQPAEETREVGGMIAELSRLHGVTRLTLPRLGPDEVDAFVRASAEAEATTQLSAALGELTRGNPLLLCELWRDLVESDAIGIAGAQAELTRPVAELRGTERIGGLVRHRVARLDPQTAAMVELAAVAGPRFELRVLRPASGLDLEALAGAFEQAVAHGVLEELPDREPAWRFTHELVRRGVYDRIPVIRRAKLHLRVGEALELLHGDDPGLALSELAHHFALAAPVGGPERGIGYNLRAAEEALAAHASSETVARLSSALALGIADPRVRARVQIDLGYALRQTQRTAEAVVAVERALELATALGERGLRAHAIVGLVAGRLGDPESDPAEEQAICEDAIATLAEQGDERSLAHARKILAILLAHQGRTAEAIAQLEQALVDAAACGDPEERREAAKELCHFLCMDATPVAVAIERCEQFLRGAQQDWRLEALIMRPLGLLQAMAGHSEDALRLIEQSDALLDPAEWSVLWLDHAAQARELAGDLAGAERQLEAMRLRHLDPTRHYPRAALRAAAELGRLCCDQGRWDDAEGMVLFVRSKRLADDSRGTAARRLALEARVEAYRGRHERAAALAESALARAEAREGYLNLRAGIWTAAAEVQRRSGRHDDAEAAIARALELYERKGNIAAAAQLRARRPAMAL